MGKFQDVIELTVIAILLQAALSTLVRSCTSTLASSGFHTASAILPGGIELTFASFRFLRPHVDLICWKNIFVSEPFFTWRISITLQCLFYQLNISIGYQRRSSTTILIKRSEKTEKLLFPIRIYLCN